MASNESRPLLPKNRKDDHPIFLRVCHSPWAYIDQQGLVALRGLVAAYLVGSFITIVHWELKYNKHEWTTIFELSNIVYFMQLLYALMSLSWTYMHLYHPHHSHEEEGIAWSIYRLLSPPRQNPTTKNRFFFSLFYTAVVTYPHVVTMVYWLILVPSREYPDWQNALFGQSKETSFVIINLFGINSVISFIEVFFLSSIRRQTPIWAHNTGLTFMSMCYVGWTFIGKEVTGRYVYWFFDHEKIGWEYVASAITSFCALASIFFAVNFGITGFREMLTRKREDKSYGYSSLPQ